MGAQPLGFAPLQPFEVTHGRHVQPGDGHRSMPGMHRVAAPSATLSRGEPSATQSAFLNHPVYVVGHTTLGDQQRVTQCLCLPYMMGRGLLFQARCHQMTQPILNL